MQPPRIPPTAWAPRTAALSIAVILVFVVLLSRVYLATPGAHLRVTSLSATSAALSRSIEAPRSSVDPQQDPSSLSVCSRVSDGDLNVTFFSDLHDVYILHAESPLRVRSIRRIEPVFFLSVVGSMSHLNFFLDVAPRGAIGLYDINSFSLRYARLFYRLLTLSRSQSEFLSWYFGRSVAKLEAAFLSQDAILEWESVVQSPEAAKNIALLWNFSASHDVRRLPVDSYVTTGAVAQLEASCRDAQEAEMLSCTYQLFHREFIAAVTFPLPGDTHTATVPGQTLRHRKCEQLLPFYPKELAPYLIPFRRGEFVYQPWYNPNLCSLYYGYGWMESAGSFAVVQRRIRRAVAHEIHVISSDVSAAVTLLMESLAAEQKRHPVTELAKLRSDVRTAFGQSIFFYISNILLASKGNNSNTSAGLRLIEKSTRRSVPTQSNANLLAPWIVGSFVYLRQLGGEVHLLANPCYGVAAGGPLTPSRNVHNNAWDAAHWALRWVANEEGRRLCVGDAAGEPDKPPLKVVEVAFRVPFGFHELQSPCRLNIQMHEFVSGNTTLLQEFGPANLILVHILVGDAGNVTTFRSVLRRALVVAPWVLVMEHNADSSDWEVLATRRRRPHPNRAFFFDYMQLEKEVDEALGSQRPRLLVGCTIPGISDNMRNMIQLIRTSVR